jgi:hypothetical protein
VTRVHAPAIASSASDGPRIPIGWSATDPSARFTVQVRQLGGDTRAHAARPTGASPWRTLIASTTRRFLRFGGRLGSTYEFRVRAVADGAPGAWSTATTIVPSGLHPAGGHYRGVWVVQRIPGAWHDRAIAGVGAGATFSLRYTGCEIAIIGERGPNNGRVRVTFDGHDRTIKIAARRTRLRQVPFLARPRPGRHRLTVRVLSGAPALEGFAIGSRTA